METLVGSPDPPPPPQSSPHTSFLENVGSRKQVGVWCQETGRQSNSFEGRPGFVSLLEATMPKV